MGSTGSGKSTFTQLLLKNYAAQEGRVAVGGRDIGEVDAGWLREKVGYVGQEPTLFNGSIRENILVGRANASDAEVWSVLKEVSFSPFRSICTTSSHNSPKNSIMTWDSAEGGCQAVKNNASPSPALSSNVLRF